MSALAAAAVGLVGVVVGSAVLILVAASLLVLTIFGVHRASLAWTLRVPRAPRPLGDVDDGALPVVTVQLPLFNEARVAARAIDAACALDWPRARLQIQVLDDSTDETRDIVQRRALLWRGRGVDVGVLRRMQRDGFKAGALAAGTSQATGELVLVLDADFVVPPTFLRDTVGEFADARVGLVQARWGHLNDGASALTRAQAVLLDAHFSVEQAGRAARGRWFNFNGTAGIWRRACVDDAGGWQGDTLSEDVDLSYRAQLRGWRFVYRDDVVVPAELPESMTAFRAQQRRWMAGLSQVCRKLLPTLLRARAPRAVRAEAALHLLAPVASVCTSLLALLLPLLPAEGTAALGSRVALYVGTAAAALFFVVAQRRRSRGLVAAMAQVPVLLALGIGIAPGNTLHCARAWRRALPFERTPKTAGARPSTAEPASGAPLDAALTFALGAWCLVGALLRADAGADRAVFLLLFAVGLLWVGASGAATLPARAAWRAPSPSRVP